MNHTSEWRRNGLLLLASVIGVSTTSIAIFALGQFLEPFEREFGWTRSETTVGMTIALLLGIVTAPIVGRLVDRVNARLLAVPGVILVGVTLAAMSLVNGNMAVWIAMWCAFTLAGSLIAPTLWLAVVSAAFDRQRNLAIALVIVGTSISAALAPYLTRVLIDAFGWRPAFYMLALVWVAPAAVLVLLFFFDRRERLAPAERARAGTPLRAIATSPTYLKLVAAIVPLLVCGSAFTINLSPVLSAGGLGPTTAAAIAGLAGLAAIPGKLFAGAAFDRFGLTRTTLAVTATYATASLMLAIGVSQSWTASLAAVLVGLAIGALGSVIACAVARLFPQDVFGTVYGSIISVMSVTAAVGPLIGNRVYDVTGQYNAVFWFGLGAAGFATLLLPTLRPMEMTPHPAE